MSGKGHFWMRKVAFCSPSDEEEAFSWPILKRQHENIIGLSRKNNRIHVNGMKHANHARYDTKTRLTHALFRNTTLF